MSLRDFLTVLGILAAVVPGLYAATLANRSSRRASETTGKIESDKLDLARFEAFEKRSDAILERNDKRIACLERDLQHEKNQRRLSNAYARTLAEVLREHDMPVPQPPQGLDL